MPRFLTTSLMQEGWALTVMRHWAIVKVKTRALDDADRDLLIEILGLDVDEADEVRVPLATGFDDRAMAARRRLSYARAAKRAQT